MLQLFDSHCHLDHPAFDADREAVLARCRAQGISHILVPGIERVGWEGLLALCRREKGLYPALGLHPLFIDRHRQADLQALEQMLAQQPPVALGEIGLDFHAGDADRARQTDFFRAQLDMAREAGLPVVLHIRKACDEVLTLLRRHPVPGGFAHAFNGSLQQAERFIDAGFKLGFGGTLTYEGSRRIRALAQTLSLDSIVLETDAPDMAMAAHRGERNSPEYLPEVLQVLARLRDEEPAVIAARTTANAREVLGL